jgi:hypothetical protein
VIYDLPNEALRGIQRSLGRDGVFTFDILNGWQMLDVTPHMHVSQAGNCKIMQFEYNRAIDKTRRVKQRDSLWVIQENSHVSLELASDELRIFFPDELMVLLENSGFETLAVYGDDLSSAFTGDSRFVTFVVRKAM